MSDQHDIRHSVISRMNANEEEGAAAAGVVAVEVSRRISSNMGASENQSQDEGEGPSSDQGHDPLVG